MLHGFLHESHHAPVTQPAPQITARRCIEPAYERLAQNRRPAFQFDLGPDQDSLTARQVRPDCHEIVFGQVVQKRKAVSASAVLCHLYAICVELSRHA